MKLVINPPSRINISDGFLRYKASVPCFRAISSMGFAAWKPKLKHALITPASTAMRSPFFNANSLTEACPFLKAKLFIL